LKKVIRKINSAISFLSNADTTNGAQNASSEWRKRRGQSVYKKERFHGVPYVKLVPHRIEKEGVNFLY
jgi:hypothetical protein